MTPSRYLSALKTVGLTQKRLVAVLRVHKDTSTRWVNGVNPIPRAADLLLRLLESGAVTIEALEAMGDD